VCRHDARRWYCPAPHRPRRHHGVRQRMQPLALA
jgi:hypothetical protein